MKRGGLGVLAVALVAVVLLGVSLARSHARPAEAAPGPENARAPQGQRVRVEVLNATRTRGLARRATQILRDHGFDVVEIGTSVSQRDTTVVLDRSGHPDWARRVAAAMRDAVVETQLDSSRYLDVTVLIGASWRPPAKPFYP